MAWGRRTLRTRREPTFRLSPNPVLDLRLSARDRAGAPMNDHSGSRRIEHARARHDTPSQDANRKSRGTSTQSPSPPARGRKRGAGGGNGRRRGIVARIFYWGFVFVLWAVIAAIGMVAWVGAHLPAIQSLEVPRRPPSIHIVGLDGHVLATRGDTAGEAIPLKELPQYLPSAVVAIEDRRFYEHHGVDPFGIARAAFANLAHRGVAQGGSTITQQLAKNLFLTQDRTLTRKVQELVLALWLERKLTKTQILELYLNRVYFGAGAYGVESAAQRYFGKSVRQVSLAEAAMLAGLVKSPSRLAPSRNPDGAARRAQAVLTAMVDTGAVNAQRAMAAIAQPAQALKRDNAGSVNYVADWIMDVLDDLIGRIEQDVVVETSIDPTLQAIAEKVLVDELTQKGLKLGVTQGAIVAMSPDGAVRAMVGGRNYAESQFNRAVAAKRQPGSAFKPFVYLTAIERGLTPETIREDAPISLKGWKPENYTHEYFGPVSLTRALALSLNTVSVRLTLEFGPTAVIRTAHRLGIASKLEPNPSIALGTSEVSLIELVSAFVPFANGGEAVVARVVERVRTLDGKNLFQNQHPSLGRVIEPRYVTMMNSMMQETLLTGTAKRAALAGWPAAGKTGTSQDFRDAWFVGYTARLVTGVWLGNDDNSPTRKMSGSGLPVDIWSRVMKTAHQGVAVAALPGLGGTNFGLFARPPSEILAPAPGTPSAPPQRGMDNWLLDRLFGRR
ncbi:MAG: PBP1A family penicillin-binding protein [Rhizobiales bacterium]|nr:PBP1A family penicillin-binding protein [Hyphomicrobiales bacterium]